MWRAITVVAGVVAVLIGAVTAVLLATGAAPWTIGADREPVPLQTPTARPAPGWAVAPDVLGEVQPVKANGADSLDKALKGEFSELDDGRRVGAQVTDLATGEVVYAADAGVGMAPASVQKILTSAAALNLLGADHRFTTAVMAQEGDPTALTLVGGGDPMLRSDETEGFTSIGDLAEATADALSDAGVTSVTLSYDESMFAGSGEDPDWESGYIPEGIVAPVSALSVDSGRIEPEARTRVSDPAAATAATFADLLRSHGIDVSDNLDAANGDGSDGSNEIASITSPPLSRIVEFLIATSDNDVAENIARHVAVADGSSGSADDAEVAVVETLTALGIDMSDTVVRDGSGLARANKVPASVVVDTLTVAASSDHPDLRPVITGLPVAGLTGTLDTRYTGSPDGVGMVRAKTGTLNQGGVHSLAGVAIDAKGHGYAFAVITNDVSVADALNARDALDAFTSVLAGF